jgi:exonuclease VII small subunit
MSKPESINKKLKELEVKTGWFYSDEFKLDEAVDKYKQAIKLARDIETALNELKNEINLLSEDFSK